MGKFYEKVMEKYNAMEPEQIEEAANEIGGFADPLSENDALRTAV